MNDRPPVPPNVAAAIIAVMGAVPKLQRTEKNTHGNYNFASIDDFLEAVRPLCAEHGLLIIQDEDAFDVVAGPKDSRWMTMRYSYTLAHSSGETWEHRPTRTIMVNTAMGSQAFGAAQSYALKQFMRSLLQIATGERDEDADTHKPESLPASRRRSPQPQPGSTESPRGQLSAETQNGGAAGGTDVSPKQSELAARAAAALTDAPNLAALDSTWERIQKRADLKPKTLQRLEAVYLEAKAYFTGVPPSEVPGETYDADPDDTEAAIADLEAMANGDR